MRQNGIVILLLLSWTSILAQHGNADSVFAGFHIDRDADSLKMVYRAAGDEPTRIQALKNLSWHYAWSFPDSAIKYATEGIRRSEEEGLAESQVNLLTSLAQAYSGKGNLPPALQADFHALELAEKTGNDDLVAWCFVSIGSIYFYAGDFENALKYFQKSRQYPAAYEKQKELYAGFLGETYYHLGILDSALFFTRQSYDLSIASKSRWPVPKLYMGKIAAATGDRQKALGYFREGLSPGLAQTDSIKGILAIANLYRDSKQPDSALFYARMAFETVKYTSLYLYAAEASALLKDLYTANGNRDSAFKYLEITLARKDSLYNHEKINQIQNMTLGEQSRQQSIRQAEKDIRSGMISYLLGAGLISFLVIAGILYRNNREKQKAKISIEKAYLKLKDTQTQLIQSEKMASLGELTAGIAHEIQNPLNFVNNFSEVNRDILEELREGPLAKLPEADRTEAESLVADLSGNMDKINEHGKRADAIVKSMLQHSRSSVGQKDQTDMNKMVDEYLRLAYHGMRAKDKHFNVEMSTDYDPAIGRVSMVPQDIGRVLLNLFNNAFYAANEKSKTAGPDYHPRIQVGTRLQKHPESVQIFVKDNGRGVPEEIRQKIFQPFFTTKPTGQGTGLGLSLSYDIVKAHGGELRVETKEGEGAEFVIQLPFS